MKWLVLIVNLFFFSINAEETTIRIGVLSDIHGDFISARNALQHFKELGVNQLIVAGDLIGFFDAESAAIKQQADEITFNREKLNQETEKLTAIYRKLRKISEKQVEDFWNLVHEFQFTAENTFFFPGNWDAAYILEIHKKDFGAQILNADFRAWSQLTLGSHRFVISHLPLFELPRDLISSRMDPLTPLNMSLDLSLKGKGDIWIFGHTHRGIIYYDTHHSIWVFNPGAALSQRRVDSPASYGMVDLKDQRIILYGLDRGILKEVSLASCGETLKEMATQ